MSRIGRSRGMRSLAALALPIVFVLALAGVAAACPTCKDNLAHDPASANLARGFYYSILFMISMPFTIFGGLSLYFWLEIRKARAAQSALPPPPHNATAVEMATSGS